MDKDMMENFIQPGSLPNYIPTNWATQNKQHQSKQNLVKLQRLKNLLSGKQNTIKKRQSMLDRREHRLVVMEKKIKNYHKVITKKKFIIDKFDQIRKQKQQKCQAKINKYSYRLSSTFKTPEMQIAFESKLRYEQSLLAVYGQYGYSKYQRCSRMINKATDQIPKLEIKREKLLKIVEKTRFQLLNDKGLALSYEARLGLVNIKNNITK